jgi:two-component system LytT family response regulator
MKYKTIIVDDEQNSVNALAKLIEMYCPELELISTFNDPRIALEYIIETQPDLIFLDIQMPFMTGLDLLKKIPLDNSHVVFTTAYDQYALDAIKLSALDYLLKPIDVEDLKKSIVKFVQSSSKEDNILKLQNFISNLVKSDRKRLVVQLQNKTLFLDIHKILYLKADSNYTTIFMDDNQQYLTSKTIKHYQEKLEGLNFFRSHQSYLLNTDFIREYDKSENCILLYNNVSIPVSKNRKEALLDVLSEM